MLLNVIYVFFTNSIFYHDITSCKAKPWTWVFWVTKRKSISLQGFVICFKTGFFKAWCSLLEVFLQQLWELLPLWGIRVKSCLVSSLSFWSLVEMSMLSKKLCCAFSKFGIANWAALNKNVALNVSVKLNNFFWWDCLCVSTSKSIAFAKYCRANVPQSKIESDWKSILIKSPLRYKLINLLSSLNSVVATSLKIFCKIIWKCFSLLMEITGRTNIFPLSSTSDNSTHSTKFFF